MYILLFYFDLSLNYLRGLNNTITFISFDCNTLQEVVEWFSNHDRVDTSRGLGILAISKGGELALHTAAYNPKVCYSLIVEIYQCIVSRILYNFSTKKKVFIVYAVFFTFSLISVLLALRKNIRKK